MEDKSIPQVYLMVKQAVENLEGVIKYQQIKNYINSHWKGVNQKTIDAQIIAATVNHSSRHHYNENHKERKSDQGSPFDLLYRIARGTIVKYDQKIHGIWQLTRNLDGSFSSSRVNIDFHKPTYLFSWNPIKWNWENLDSKIIEFKSTGKTREIWTCSCHKKIAVGDRAFLMKLGGKDKNKGIFASGFIVSEPFKAPAATDPSRKDWRVILEFDMLFDPHKTIVINSEKLKDDQFNAQNWFPQTSGISIEPTIAIKLEELWLKKMLSSYEKSNDKFYLDGAIKQRLVKVYERSPYARAECLKYYGPVCIVCGLDFSKKYGKIGENFIHIHHLNELHTIKKAHEINPLKDLVPICPNCHSMVHARKKPCFTIQEIKDKINQQKLKKL
jgi:5-methylcytosine-specific restriction protein A